MSYKQRLFVIAVVIAIVGYGLMQSDNQILECYILRTEDGVNFSKDQVPVFTNNDIASYDPVKKEYIFKKTFKEKIENDKLMSINYRNSNNELILREDYWLEGISSLGARYPDRFIILIDGEKVIDGYFETPAYMSYLPPGKFIRTTEKGIQIVDGYDESSLSMDDVIEVYFEKN